MIVCGTLEFMGDRYTGMEEMYKVENVIEDIRSSEKSRNIDKNYLSKATATTL